MMRLIGAALLCAVVGRALAQEGRFVQVERPNIVLIYADDLGYGDVSCYGASAVETPHIDRLAQEGIRFTDAHSAAATCTPSRYAMMAGLYAWRRPGTGILAGDAPLVLEPGLPTMASLLQSAGYRTSFVGKWHLGLGEPGMDWNGSISPGPLEVGFDECFLVPATGDRVPTVYVENRSVVGLDPNDPITVSFKNPIGDEPVGREHPELLKMPFSHGHDQTIINGISRIGYMSGGRATRWVDETMADTLTARATDFIQRHSASENPFFLFFSLHDIHVPRTPHPRFQGVTGMGPRGDAIAQADDCVGAVLKKLDELDIASNTIVIFTSDNGPVVDDGYADQAVERLGEHRPAGPLRGGKYSSFEGGTRVPMVVRWPGVAPPGMVSPALICQIDFPACFASIAGVTLRPDQCPDSKEHSDVLAGSDDFGRWLLVEQGASLAVRHAQWKYIEPKKGPAVFANTAIESGLSLQPQLYDLSNDLGETKNLAKANPKKLAEMQELLQAIRDEGF